MGKQLVSEVFVRVEKRYTRLIKTKGDNGTLPMMYRPAD